MNYMGKANKEVICEVLLAAAAEDKDIAVLCSDSRGSGSMTEFARQYPKQFIEVGIAEQNLVSVSAGLASCGKKVFAVSPASFLSTRSMEQIKVDVAYSYTNVKLIGISGGISYGALGMTHHSANDIAVISSIPQMRTYIPSDRLQTRCLMQALLKDDRPAYIRVGRNAVPDVYTENAVPFAMDKASIVQDGGDAAIIACGEMVWAAREAGRRLAAAGISTRVIDMYCLKPLDEETIVKAARECRVIVTVEEHVAWGGLGAMVCRTVCAAHPCRVRCLTLPDAPVVTGKSQEVFDYYGLNADGIVKTVKELLR